jgi:hypothetical protein
VSEYERTHLFNWFEEHMGTDRATTMMNLLPPVGWGDVATRRDLEQLEERLDHKIDSAFGQLDRRIEGVDHRIDLVDARLDAVSNTMTGLATTADVVESRYELQRTLVTWIFLAQASVVAAVGLLIAYLG